MAKRAKKTDTQVEVQEIKTQEITFNLLGENLIMNRYAAKAWRELLFPSVKVNRAGLEQSLKHDPVAEFRDAMYRCRDTKAKTLIHLPNGAVKGALASAALDIPGTAKAKIERLTQVVDVNIELYGIPQLFCAMVRNSDQNHTPDVRTRPIFPEWCAKVTVNYVSNILSQRTVANLLGAAGVIVGIGDWRPQKGGPYGKFRLVGDNDRAFQNIIKNQARAAQQKAYDVPIHFDPDTAELMAWFEEEVARREMSDLLSTNSGNGRMPKTKRVFVERGRYDSEFVGEEASDSE